MRRRIRFCGSASGRQPFMPYSYRVWHASGPMKPIVLMLAIAIAFVSSAFAQSRDARLLVTIVDPSGGVIPGAIVTVVGLEEGTTAAARPAVKTAENGVATLAGLAAGRYTVQAEFE